MNAEVENYDAKAVYEEMRTAMDYESRRAKRPAIYNRRRMGLTQKERCLRRKPLTHINLSTHPPPLYCWQKDVIR